jgi:hypothetical protein
MDWILPTVFHFQLSRLCYRPNKNLCEWKWWYGFSNCFRPFSPLVFRVWGLLEFDDLRGRFGGGRKEGKAIYSGRLWVGGEAVGTPPTEGSAWARQGRGSKAVPRWVVTRLGGEDHWGVEDTCWPAGLVGMGWSTTTLSMLKEISD